MKEAPRHFHYLAASFGLTALAALIRWVADPFLADTGHYIPFYLAVAVVATLAGTAYALMTVAFSALAGFLLFVYLPGRFQPETSQDFVQLPMYIQGSTFFFTVRVPEAAQQGNGHPEARPELSGARVLIVTPDKSRHQRLVKTLSGWGMEPTTTVDIPGALAKIHQAATGARRFQVVLVDAHMPDFDGFTLAEWLKNEPHLAGPVVLMLDAAVGGIQRRRCVDLGALWLEDHASDSDLMAVVAEALQTAERKGGQATLADRDSEPARPLRVLLAEDAPANQKLVVHVLSNRGHSVDVAHNGQQAVEMLEREHFDAVLMDVQMPIMDGFQATRKMRQMRGRKARVPIIAMTDHALKGDAERCLAAGMDAYLSKPGKQSRRSS